MPKKTSRAETRGPNRLRLRPARSPQAQAAALRQCARLAQATPHPERRKQS